MKSSDDKNEEIVNHLKTEIEKSGFPLEIKSSLILQKQGWNVIPHILYFEPKSKTNREIDISAFFSEYSKTPLTVNTLIIECKKQEKRPWVFFEQNKLNDDFTSVCVRPMECYKWFKTEFKNHYYYNQKPCSFHFPAFVKKGKSDVILEAVNQVVNAVLFTLETLYETDQINWFFYPIIVLDGQLFSATIDYDGKINLTNRDYLQLCVTKGLDKPVELKLSESEYQVNLSRRIIIDIIKIDFFEEYLKQYHPYVHSKKE